MAGKPTEEGSYADEIAAEYAALASRQRDYFRQLATRVETGEEVSELDRKLLASLVRHWADTLKLKPPRRRGQQPLFNHFDAQFLYYAWTVPGRMKKAVALAKVAEQYGVSIEAMRACIKKTPAGMKEFFE
ncbi:MAG: hypothetical protein NTW01_09140 [Gammaproteobacteria bacterium]|nr:hypothetical protein [Gammaproteobacteria bacterium]